MANIELGYAGMEPVTHHPLHPGGRVTIVQKWDDQEVTYEGHLRSVSRNIMGDSVDLEVCVSNSTLQLTGQRLEKHLRRSEAKKKEQTMKFVATYVREPRTGMITVYLQDQETKKYVDKDGNQIEGEIPGKEPVVFASLPEQYFDAMTKAKER
jgi:hypothetical protein